MQKKYEETGGGIKIMTKCEFHDEAFKRLHEGIQEIKKKLEDGTNEFKDLQKSKLGWATFTWIIGMLMVVWMGIQAILWAGLTDIQAKVTKMDKDLAVHNAQITKEPGVNHGVSPKRSD